MSGMQASRTNTKTIRDKKKKVVKNTTSCPGFLVFFSLQGRVWVTKQLKGTLLPSPILENDFLIIDK